MKKCVTTLPISPNAFPDIGLAILPLFMDAVGIGLGYQRLLSLNINGLKIGQDARDLHVQYYLRELRKLNIGMEYVWQDGQGENIYLINKLFCRLEKSGHIYEDQVYVFRCGCGAVEFLAEADNLSEKRKVYLEDGGEKICKLCNGHLRLFQERSYLFRFPEVELKTQIFPLFYAVELQNLLKLFAGRSIMLSRRRETGVTLWIGTKAVNIDVDFAWFLMVPILREYGYDPRVIIASGRNLLACAFIIAICNIFDCEEYSLIIPPYFHLPNKKSFKNEIIWKINDMARHYCPQAIRAFLFSSNSWNKKEVSVNRDILNLLQNISVNIQGVDILHDNLNSLLEKLERRFLEEKISRGRKRGSENITLATYILGEK